MEKNTRIDIGAEYSLSIQVEGEDYIGVTTD